MLNRIRTMKTDNEQGFTLIELLVVIIIIGILAAIAIPVFLNQRQKANDAAVTADVKQVATQIETYLVDFPDATSPLGTGTPAITDTAGLLAALDVNLTDGVDVVVTTDGTEGYEIRGGHSNGGSFVDGAETTDRDLGASTKVLVYNSADGGLQ